MSSDFDLQQYLTDWRKEQREDIGAMRDDLTMLSIRVTRIEVISDVMSKGRWIIFAALVTFVFDMIVNHGAAILHAFAR